MIGEHVMPDGQVILGASPVDYLIILAASVAILLIFPLLLLWGWRRGQFKDIEEAKYRMLEMEEEHVD